MSRSIMTLLAITASILGVSLCSAQTDSGATEPLNDTQVVDYEAQIREQMDRFRAMGSQICHDAMQNPYVQRAFRNFLDNGGNSSFQDFVIRFCQTGEFDSATTGRQTGKPDKDNYTISDKPDGITTRDWRDSVPYLGYMETYPTYKYETYVDRITGTKYELSGHFNEDRIAYDGNGNVFTVDPTGIVYRYDGKYWRPLSRQDW